MTAKLIDINMINGYEYMNINCTQQYGGISYSVTLDQKLVDLLKWVENHKANVEKEEQLRKTNPALASTWEQYQTMLKIVMDHV
jgi:hypothetical protein